MGPAVDIIEVSPRDGLQNEAQHLSTSAKVELIARALASGVRRIEVTSFVNPALVPQMADAEAVLESLPKSSGVSYSVLVLNDRGLDRAMAAGANEVNLVVVASDTFGMRNQRQTVDDGIKCVSRLAERAKAAGLQVTATIGAAFGCPFEGEISASRVIEIVQRLSQTGVLDELSLADTIGVAVPTDVSSLVGKLHGAVAELPPLRLHLHDTRHTGVANAYAGWQEGVTRFDASIGGAGGCPFAPNATGNVATEDLVFLFDRMGVLTGIDLTTLCTHVPWFEEQLQHSLPGAISRSGGFPLPRGQEAP
jgi:hydroxymethylglutaryl-CoA lyase